MYPRCPCLRWSHVGFMRFPAQTMRGMRQSSYLPIYSRHARQQLSPQDAVEAASDARRDHSNAACDEKICDAIVCDEQLPVHLGVPELRSTGRLPPLLAGRHSLLIFPKTDFTVYSAVYCLPQSTAVYQSTAVDGRHFTPQLLITASVQSMQLPSTDRQTRPHRTR